MRRFLGNTDGAMAIYAVFVTGVVIGAGVLALDFGKAAVLKSQMQNSADSLAMSGAKQLDGHLGARANARAVIYSNMRQGSNIQDTPGDFTVQTVIFYARYSRDDPTPTGCVADGTGGNNSGCDTVIVDDNWADGDLVTRAVEVRLASENVSMILKPLIDLASNSSDGAKAFNVNARAVAERGDVACDIAPFFVCNPDESGAGGMDLRDPAQTGGRMMVVKDGAGATPPDTPGNFGVLCAEISDDGTCLSSGSNAVKQTLIGDTSGLCSGSGGVATKPGVSMGPIVKGIQTRFDVPDSGSGTPARNIMGHYKDPDAAEFDETTDVPGKPMGDRPSNALISSDGWNLVRYWNITHNGFDGTEADVSTNTTNVPSVLLPDGSLPLAEQTFATRYQTYLFENDVTFCRKGYETYYDGAGGTGGFPQCYTSGSDPSASLATENGSYTYSLTPTSDTQRRVFTIASVNCQALTDAGLPIQGNTEKIPVGGGFIDFYITESGCQTGADCNDSGQSSKIRHARRNYATTTTLDKNGNVYAEVIGPTLNSVGAQKIITNVRLID